jgi:hypothetical protein
MKNLILILLISASTLAQEKVNVFIDTKNTDTSLVEVYSLELDYSDTTNIKADNLKLINTFVYAKIDSNSYRLVLNKYSNYVVRIFNPLTYQQKFITLFIGNTSPNKVLIANFETNKLLAVAYNYQTNIYEYIIYQKDSVLKEERYKPL